MCIRSGSQPKLGVLSQAPLRQQPPAPTRESAQATPDLALSLNPAPLIIPQPAGPPLAPVRLLLHSLWTPASRPPAPSQERLLGACYRQAAPLNLQCCSSHRHGHCCRPRRRPCCLPASLAQPHPSPASCAAGPAVRNTMGAAFSGAASAAELPAPAPSGVSWAAAAVELGALRPAAAPGAGSGATQEDPPSFYEAVLAACAVQAPRMAERLRNTGPLERAQLDAMGRQVAGLPQADPSVTPVEVAPGLLTFMPTDHEPEYVARVGAAVADILRDAAGDAAAPAAPAAPALATPAGTHPPVKCCLACGAVPPQGIRLKKCGGCRQVGTWGVQEARGHAWGQSGVAERAGPRLSFPPACSASAGLLLQRSVPEGGVAGGPPRGMRPPAAGAGLSCARRSGGRWRRRGQPGVLGGQCACDVLICSLMQRVMYAE